MDPITESLLAAVEPELGYKERPGQHTKFGAWYATTVGDPQYRNAPWCDMFIAWAANKAGVAEYVGEFAWTPSHARWFERHDAWSTEPEPGALVFFDWSGSGDIKKIDHVGIVERVGADGRIHTIEANVDRVWLKRKVREESKVVGYGLPRKVKEYLTLRDATAQGRPGQIPRQAVLRPVDAAGPAAHNAVPVELVPATTLLVLLVGLIVLPAGRLLARAPGRHRRPRNPAHRHPYPRPPAESGRLGSSHARLHRGLLHRQAVPRQPRGRVPARQPR